MGGHTHYSESGVAVHVAQRDGTYLARGSFDSRRFGITLGSDRRLAEAKLREVLHDLDSGTFVTPSDARRRPLRKRCIARIDLRHVMGEYLDDVRKLNGATTSTTYKSRLMPVLEFAEIAEHRKKWKYAVDLDRSFAVALRGFLFQRHCAANGRPTGPQRPVSSATVRHQLECLRSMLHWAARQDVALLPCGFPNPLTADIVGQPPKKDPLREDKMPMELRTSLVSRMDFEQLKILALPFVLPLRPSEFTGLLVSDVDFERNCFRVGTRLGGDDGTKERTSFVMPFPEEFRSFVAGLIEKRNEGPLLRCPKARTRRDLPTLSSHDDLVDLFRARLANCPSDSVLTEQDRKREFRTMLVELGGVSERTLARTFDRLMIKSGSMNKSPLKTLRHANTQGMKASGMPHLELVYLTSHAVNSIMNEYTPLDPFATMRKYFESIKPLIEFVMKRGRDLGLPGFGSAE
jgi:integrase